MSTEKSPEFRIVGGAPQEEKEMEKRDLQELLFSHFQSLSPEAQKMLKKFEHKKSEKERALIDLANQEIDRLRQKAGLASYTIPYENYHLLPPKKYQEMQGESTAVAIHTDQGIMFNAENRSSPIWPVEFGENSLHETLHLKGHFAEEVEETPDKNINVTGFRAGVIAYGAQRGKPHGHFSGLDEAIVAAQSKKSYSALLGLSIFDKERELLMSSKAKETRRNMAKKLRIPEDEIKWVDKKRVGLFSYFPQRQVLDYVCSEIQKELPQQYQNKDDVFQEFLRAHFTGRLLPIARIVEKTFGEGSFRILGNMTDDMTDEGEENVTLHMESLRKARARQQKRKKIN